MLTHRIVFVEELPDFEEERENEPHLSQHGTSELCPKKPPLIVGPVLVDSRVSGLERLNGEYKPYRPGGHFRPQGCVSRTTTAVIVPYRNRQRHLQILLNHLIPFLVRQQAEFAIFVVEMVADTTFNRALLLNVGFVESLKTNNFTCIVFHDVDLLPESDYNLYRCGVTPRHMAVANSKYGYELLFPEYFGGVVSMSSDIYKDVNGHSNLYFGWGGEDDDILYRLVGKNKVISRYPPDIGVYTALSHTEDVGNPVNTIRRDLLLSATKRMDEDGLNSLNYKIVKLQQFQLYTWILIDIDPSYYRNMLARWQTDNQQPWLFARS